ncbi:MLP1_6 [Sanghuangporus sanghuang]
MRLLCSPRGEGQLARGEKASGQSGVVPVVEGTDVAQVRQLEAEKAKLSRARDDALAGARDAEERVLSTERPNVVRWSLRRPSFFSDSH